MSLNIRKSDPVLLIYYIVLILFFAWIQIKGKQALYLGMNQYHAAWLDKTMAVLTWLGDGLTAAMIAAVLIFVRFRLAIFTGITWLTSGLIVQLLKRFVFPDALRPHAYFNEIGTDIYTVPGIEIHLNHSFPSGHTATAFAVFMGLGFFTRNIYLKFFLFLLACITAFSRVYLGEHFPADVLAGSVVGVGTSLILYTFVRKWKKSWLDKSLIRLINQGSRIE